MMIFTVHQFLRKQELSQIIVKFGLVMILECGVQLDYSNSLDHITTLLQKKIMPMLDFQPSPEMLGGMRQKLSHRSKKQNVMRVYTEIFLSVRSTYSDCVQ